MNLPSGTVTFLFTDIEGSTRLWEEYPLVMAEAVARHERIAAAIIEAHEGVLVKSRGEGDSLFIVFARATDAVAAACALQIAFVQETWPEGIIRLKVRMALHTGEAHSRDGDYYGPVVNRCGRLRSIAHGGQVILSEVTHGLVRDRLPEGAGLTDLGVHRLRDLTRGERVFQLIHPLLPADFPPLRSLETMPNNLPRQLTALVGREREMAEVQRYLSSAPLVTLTGAGGCGKTRLALQVAAESVENFEDGVFFIDLAPLADPDDVVTETAATLRVREEPGRPLLMSLTDFLRAKSLLLIFDNCEHVLAAVASLAYELLRACPRLHLMATSREPLGIAGETTYRVPSLDFPDAPPDTAPQTEPGTGDVERLLRYDAVRLFVERATAVAASQFPVTLPNVSAAARICARLDGIPLALELAAARVGALSVEQIAARLSDRFLLLTRGSPTALPRHQTLRATVDFSYDLLTVPERQLLGRLSVFAGGFTLEAAEAICAAPCADPEDAAPETLPIVIRPADVADVLARLVEKSMVVFDEQEGAGRYRLLEIIRQYAAERLQESGAGEEVRRCHYDYFLAWAESSPEPSMDEFETEHDNLRAALDTCLQDPAGGEAGLRLSAALWTFWQIRNHLREGCDRYAAVLAHPGAQEPTRLRALALNCAGNLILQMRDYDEASALYEASLAIRQAIGDERGMAASFNNLANVWSEKGDLGRARKFYQQALAIQQRLGLERGIPISLFNLADIAIMQKSWKQARRLLNRSRRLHENLGGGARLRYVLRGLGQVALGEGKYSEAHTFFAQSLAFCREMGDKRNTVPLLRYMSQLAYRTGNSERAALLYGACEVLRSQLGLSPDAPAERAEQKSELRTVLGDAAFDRWTAEGASLSWEDAIAYAIRDDYLERPEAS